MATTISVNKFQHVESRSLGDVPVWELAGYMVLFLTCFFNLVALDSTKVEIKLDFQVYIKLVLVGCSGLYGLMGFLTDQRVRSTAFSFPVAWVLLICGLCMVASLRAIEPMAAMASSISILCIYLMTITAAISLGRIKVVKTVFGAAAMFVFGSWLVYFLKPEIGVMEEPILGGEFVARMGGLSHPNTLGQFAGISTILGTIFCWRQKQVPKLLGFLIVISILALFMSYSRSAMLATIGSFVVVCRKMIFERSNLKWIFAFVVTTLFSLIVACFTVDLDRVTNKYFSTISKSGDVEEITTATGRGEIWKKSIQLIREKPALGYGPTSSKFLLEEYSLYTHNLWLNVGLSCGVIGLLAAIVMCISRLNLMFGQFSPIADGLFVFIVLNGVFENIIFSNLCGLPTICWVLALAWFQMGTPGFQIDE